MNHKKNNYVGGEGIPVVWPYPNTVCDINPYIITLKKRRREITEDTMKNKRAIQNNSKERNEELGTDLGKVGNETSKICLKTMCDKHRTLVAKRCRHLLDTPCNSLGKFDGHCPNEIYNKHDHAALLQGRISNVSDHVCNNQHIFRNHGHLAGCGNINTTKKEPVGKITGNMYQTKINASTWNEFRGNERRNSDIYQCFQGLRSEIRKLRYEVLRLGCRLNCGKIDCTCNRISRSELSNFRNFKTPTNKKRSGIN